MAHEQGQDDGGREKTHPAPEESSGEAVDQEVPAEIALDLLLCAGCAGRGFGHGWVLRKVIIRLARNGTAIILRVGAPGRGGAKRVELAYLLSLAPPLQTPYPFPRTFSSSPSNICSGGTGSVPCWNMSTLSSGISLIISIISMPRALSLP